MPKPLRQNDLDAYLDEALPPEEMESAVIFEASQVCPFSYDDATVDYHVVSTDTDNTSGFLVAARNQLINSRVDHGSHWGPDHAESLFLMLVHPVFNKYTNGPRSSLVRLIDVLLIMQEQPTCIERIIGLLQQSGLLTAGWITATWLHHLTGEPRAERLATMIQPGKPRKRYLTWWLTRGMSTRWQESEAQVHLGFSLPAHDTLHDAVRATKVARQCRQQGEAVLHQLERTLQDSYDQRQTTTGQPEHLACPSP